MAKTYSGLFRLGKIIRLTSLSVLFGGSISIVLAAITLVKAGVAKGLTVSEAAMNNAPVFIVFSKVIAVVCVALLLAEVIDSVFKRPYTKLKLAQYTASILCCICGFIFAFYTAPLMEHLLTLINQDPAAHETFHSLHESSRLLFSGIIVFAWIALILPIFGWGKPHGTCSEGKKTA